MPDSKHHSTADVIQHWIDHLAIRLREVEIGLPCDGLAFVDLQGRRHIAIRPGLARPNRNETVLHEIGHHRLDHKGVAFSPRALGCWLEGHDERDASNLALEMAMPVPLLARFGVTPCPDAPTGWRLPEREGLLNEIAEAADVTLRFVALRLGLAHWV